MTSALGNTSPFHLHSVSASRRFGVSARSTATLLPCKIEVTLQLEVRFIPWLRRWGLSREAKLRPAPVPAVATVSSAEALSGSALGGGDAGP
jgi:hypothetical protein